MREDGGTPRERMRLAYALLVLATGEDKIRVLEMVTDREPGPAWVAERILRAGARPPRELRPARPSSVVAEREAWLPGLRAALSPWGIAAEAGPVREAERVFHLMELDLGQKPGLGPVAPAWWHQEPAARAEAFFAAARRFLEVRPWERVPPDYGIEARAGRGPWRVLVVTGHLAEPQHDPGFAVFEDVAALQRFLARSGPFAETEAGSLATLRAARAMESVSLHPVQALHPVDADHLAALGLLDLEEERVFLPVRYTPRGPERPSLGECAALLEALADALPRGDGVFEVRVRAAGEEVVLRMPAEAPSAGEGAD